MTPLRQIRADFDASTIVVYQAYRSAIADPALASGRFVPPFSFNRMTWIKPSLPWLLHRSIQVGVGRSLVRNYAEEWVVALRDLTPTVHKIGALVRAGQAAKAQRLLPPERPYPLDPVIARRIQAAT
ncbi:MAG: DUF4291 family protein [Kineosporiaceae bacterium]|jgi:hypothetical protein